MPCCTCVSNLAQKIKWKVTNIHLILIVLFIKIMHIIFKNKKLYFVYNLRHFNVSTKSK